VRGERQAPSPMRGRAAETVYPRGPHGHMSSSNAWAAFAGIFARTRAAYLELEHAKSELKGLMPEDAKEAVPGKALRDKFHGPPHL
jgi:hypothetical protein